MAIYKDDRGVESGTYPEQHQLVARVGFEPGNKKGMNGFSVFIVFSFTQHTKSYAHFPALNIALGTGSGPCCNPRKVSRGWLATHQVNKRTNNTNNGP